MSMMELSKLSTLYWREAAQGCACRSLYNTIIIVRILLTWFPNPPQVIASPLR